MTTPPLKYEDLDLLKVGDVLKLKWTNASMINIARIYVISKDVYLYSINSNIFFKIPAYNMTNNVYTELEIHKDAINNLYSIYKLNE